MAATCTVNLGHAMQHYATIEGMPDGIGKGAVDNCGEAPTRRRPPRVTGHPVLRMSSSCPPASRP